ncbi:MAG TPA: DNA recombination protein RmuC [Acidimicrobiales bacterium]|nr:DNA recombination protein RmuC [Acidimicrobiales bacterium]
MDLGLLALAAAIVVAALLLRRRGPAAGSDGAQSAEAEVARTLQQRVDQTAATVSELLGKFEERRRLEEEATGAVARIERLVAGSWSKGRAGENLLAAALSEFPPEMVERDFTLGGRVCEFAIVLADGKLLPIDSKWPGVDAVSRLDAEVDPSAREEARRQVERAACARLREVGGYIDASLTAPLAVMAVPDAAYACCRKAHRMAKELRVLIVSYSLAVPVLMAVWNLYGTYAREVDQAQLLARIDDAGYCLQEMGERLEGQLSRGLKMAANATVELRTLAATARQSLDAVRAAAPVERVAAGEGDLR